MKNTFYILIPFLFVYFGCKDYSVAPDQERRINIDYLGELSISYPDGYIGKSFVDPRVPEWVFYVRKVDELVDIHLSETCDYLSLPDTLRCYYFFPDTLIQVFANNVLFEFQNGYLGALYHDNDNQDTTGFRNTTGKILLQSRDKNRFKLLLQASYNYKYQDELVNILKTIKYN